jgi:hypothetical protein
MQGATLGEAMIEQSLNSEAENYEILAESNAINRIGARYIESGFIATGFTENYHGIPVFSIIRNDSKILKLFKTKNMNAEDLISLEKNNRKDIVVTTASSQQGLLESFKRVGHEYVLTRYFQDKNTNQWVAVMEQVQPEMLL